MIPPNPYRSILSGYFSQKTYGVVVAEEKRRYEETVEIAGINAKGYTPAYAPVRGELVHLIVENQAISHGDQDDILHSVVLAKTLGFYDSKKVAVLFKHLHDAFFCDLLERTFVSFDQMCSAPESNQSAIKEMQAHLYLPSPQLNGWVLWIILPLAFDEYGQPTKYFLTLHLRKSAPFKREGSYPEVIYYPSYRKINAASKELQDLLFKEKNTHPNEELSYDLTNKQLLVMRHGIETGMSSKEALAQHFKNKSATIAKDINAILKEVERVTAYRCASFEELILLYRSLAIPRP